ncbi:hypothetical protein [Streptococcus lutetiensis]|uniref:hypothetical protein n=1 Tax=Streptococcus lutetiensis TaxID=150055 RepID=UPI000E4ABF6E|nr:hypothetical protein [Streptococcus lutetiensis]RHF36873.1 hypothetical protein DW688_07355 [Streptococcus lutetiensis]
MNEDLIIKVADKIIESSKTYGEALQLCKRVEREIELRAYEQKIKTQKGADMNELEKTALNEILRTVTYIAEKVDEIDSKISLDDSQVLEHQEN